MARRWIGALTLGLALVWGLSRFGPPPSRVGVGFEVGYQHETDRDALTLYRAYCLRCHAADDDGGMAGSLIDDDWTYARTRSEWFDATANGIEQAGMPGFGSVLSREEIDSLIDLMEEPERIRALDGDRPRRPERTTVMTRRYRVGLEDWIPGGLSIPWGIQFIDERTALVTERPGGLRLIVDGWLHPDPIIGTPDVLHMGQGGMMDVAIDPEYRENGWVYLAFTHALNPNDPRRTGALTKVVRGRIVDHTWTDEEIVFEGHRRHYTRTRHHYGSRIVFDNDGMLYFAIGDRGDRPRAQELDRPNGKVFRLHPDGSIPRDNPFVGVADALPGIFSYGHRNPQGLSLHPETGAVWVAEHGPRGGDELNIIEPGKNYGWPVITYGINYNGTIITRRTHAEGMEQPTLYWVPSIAVCGVEFCAGEEFPDWENDLIVTGIVTEQVRRVVNDGGRVIHDELLFEGQGRVRDVGFDHEGVMYVVTNNPDRVLRVTNRGPAQRR